MPSITKYQPVLPRTDPVPPNTSQYPPILTQYHHIYHIYQCPCTRIRTSMRDLHCLLGLVQNTNWYICPVSTWNFWLHPGGKGLSSLKISIKHLILSQLEQNWSVCHYMYCCHVLRWWFNVLLSLPQNGEHSLAKKLPYLLPLWSIAADD